MASKSVEMYNRKRPAVKFAPRELFEEILKYCVIPTFDLIVELPPNGEVVIARRTIAPYENKWALPGLRMLKPENIDDVIARIAGDELGLHVNLGGKRYVGQYVGRFKTEHERQDISTGYAVTALGGDLVINRDHFSDHQLITNADGIPGNIGAMYKYYLQTYFQTIRNQ
jgi:ADP-ribose pyrophosphatase YjhB (NUDIX family)